MPLTERVERRLVVRHRHVHRGGVLGVEARHRAQQDGAIAHRARERPGLVERGGVGDDAPARAASIGRLDADDAGEGCGLADRAAGIGAGRAGAQAGRDGRGRAAGRAARHQLRVRSPAPPRRGDRAETGVLVGRAHGELVIVELAQHHGAVAPEVGADGGFVGRDEALQDVRAGGGAHAGGAEHVLDAERNTRERPALAARQRRVGAFRHFSRALRGLQNEGVERPRSGHRGDMRLGEFRCRNLPLAQRDERLREGARSELTHSACVSSQAKRGGAVPPPPASGGGLGEGAC